MKQLTVKDFIVHNNPCFSCAEKQVLKIISTEGKQKVSLNPTLNTIKETLEIDLIITYSSALQLKIYYKSNKFISHNMKDLTVYLRRHKLYLVSTCFKCGTTIKSQNLEFDLNKNIIKPFKIKSEVLLIVDNNTYFTLKSNFDKNTSHLTVSKEDKNSTELDMPLQPLEKFKDREHFLSKMKTLLLFS